MNKFNIIDTKKEHSDMVDSILFHHAALIAEKTAEFTDYYILLHIHKPKWCPVFLYHFFIKHFVNLTTFRK